MKQKLLQILALSIVLFTSAQAFAQNTGTLSLGYDTPDQNEAWDGFNMQNAPLIFTYNHSGSQVIYQPEELAAMKGQQITSLSFKCFSENCYLSEYKSTMKIYLQEMDAKEFYYDEVGEYYEWVKFDQNNVIATKEFTADFLSAAINLEDIEITFDLSKNPYTYTGKTLVITVVNDAPRSIDGSEGSVRFYWIGYTGKEHPWSSLVFASDSKDFFTNQAKDNAVKPLDNEDKWKNAPAVKFTYQSAKTGPFSGGEGTAEKPYLISSVEDLQEMDVLTNQGKTKGVHFELTKDLTEVPFTGVVGSVDNFFGNFNGNNHCILLNINKPEAQFVGLFGCVFGGTIKNLQVKGNVIGKSQVGGAVGQACQNAYLENIVNYCNVTGYASVGGVAGEVLTQEPSAGCIVSKCANYGTITGKSMTGGVIGGCGQQVGNDIKFIANYGYINGNYKPGGLIGNARAYDKIYYGLNASAASTNKAQGCIGNTISSTIGDLYYDAQYINNPKANPLQAKKTIDLIGNSLKSSEAKNGFSEKYWLFAENLYPRLRINGLENSDIFKLYATPVLLAADNTLDNVTTDFTVVTENGVTWTSKNGKVSILGNKACPIALGEDVLIATLNGISRELPINVTKFNGVEDLMNENINTVATEHNAIVLHLTEKAFVQIVNIAGQTVANGYFTEGMHNIQVNAGIYIAKVGNETFKVCVID